MSRRYISALLAILTLAVLTVRATDVWVSKEWKQWSKDECARVLVESPWSHIWRGRTPGVNTREATETLTPAHVEAVDYVVYSVQIRSALPVRQAIIRQQQIDLKYDKMADEQRKAFDVQAAQILSRKYDDAILVHVDYSKGKAASILAGDLHVYVQKGIEDLDALLTTEDGTQIKASHFDINPKSPYSFDLVFPRVVDGAPAIKEGQKRIAVQFMSPQLIGAYGGVNIPKERVRVEFDLTKMMIEGRLNY
jgi:hypothetical protein